MNYLIAFVLLILSLLSFKIGWWVCCIARGKKNTLKLANDIKYTEAVANIGIDWSYGKYQLLETDPMVGLARKLLST